MQDNNLIDLKKNQTEQEYKTAVFWLKLGKLFLHLLVFLLPLFFLPLTIAPVEINKQVFAGVLVLAGFISYLIFSLQERKIIYPKSLIGLAVLILAVIWGISAIFSEVKIASFWGNLIQPDSLASLLIYGVVFFLAAVFLRKKNLRSLGIAFFTGLSLTTIVGLLGVLRPHLLGAGFNTVGTLLDLAIFEAFGLLMIIAILFNAAEIKPGAKILLSLSGLLIIFQLILLNYSFIWLILMAAILLLAAYEFINTVKLNVRLIILVGGLLLFVLAGPFLASFIQLPTEIRPSLSSTWAIFKDSLNFKQLFLGNGPATFGYSWLLHRPLELNQTDLWSFRFNQGFSFLATILATTGVLGVLAVLFLIFSFIRQLIKKRVDPPIFIISLGLIFLLLAWLFAPLSFTQAFFIFMGLGLITALFDSTSSDGSNPSQAADAGPASGGVKEISFVRFKKSLIFAVFIFYAVLIIGSFWGLFIAGKKYIGAIYYAKGSVSANSQNNLDGAISQLDRARRLDPGADQYFRMLSQVLLAKANKLAEKNAPAGSAQTGQSEIQDTITAAIGMAKQAAVINGNDSLNWNNLGSVYEGLIPVAMDAANLAEENYLKAMRLNPKNPQEPVNLARSLVRAADIYGTGNADLKQEKLNKAKSYLEASLKLKNDYAAARFLEAAISLREGKTNEAIGKLESIKKSAPLDAGLAFQLGLLYYQNNQLDKAQREFEWAISINSNYSNARYFLGLIYDRFDKKSAALEQFKKIAQLNPDNQEVKRIIDNLASGETALGEIVPPAQLPLERTEAPLGERK